MNVFNNGSEIEPAEGETVAVFESNRDSWQSYDYFESNRVGLVVYPKGSKGGLILIPWHNIGRVKWGDFHD